MVDAFAMMQKIGEEVLLMMVFSCINYVALLHTMLANVSAPHSLGWGTMAATVRWWPPWFIVF